MSTFRPGQLVMIVGGEPALTGRCCTLVQAQLYNRGLYDIPVWMTEPALLNERGAIWWQERHLMPIDPTPEVRAELQVPMNYQSIT